MGDLLSMTFQGDTNKTSKNFNGTSISSTFGLRTGQWEVNLRSLTGIIGETEHEAFEQCVQISMNLVCVRNCDQNLQEKRVQCPIQQILIKGKSGNIFGQSFVEKWMPVNSPESFLKVTLADALTETHLSPTKKSLIFSGIVDFRHVA